jgi:hypothetical protein
MEVTWEGIDSPPQVHAIKGYTVSSPQSFGENPRRESPPSPLPDRYLFDLLLKHDLFRIRHFFTISQVIKYT